VAHAPAAGQAASSAPAQGSSAPTPSSPPLPQGGTGYVTNYGDGNAIDIFANGSGQPQYGDGSQLTAVPKGGRGGQSFLMAKQNYNGAVVYQFGDGLNTNQLIDEDAAGGGKIALWHCACFATNQMWRLTQDSTTPQGVYYLHNVRFNDCLTDNGSGQYLTAKPCVAGNKAQQWYVPTG